MQFLCRDKIASFLCLRRIYTGYRGIRQYKIIFPCIMVLFSESNSHCPFSNSVNGASVFLYKVTVWADIVHIISIRIP